MADRPWITSQEIKDYTDYPKVQNRTDIKLQTDIIRAENYIIQKTNNDFADNDKYPVIPPDIKLATMLIAEFYANTATQDPQKQYKSETFKDYSYTVDNAVTNVTDIDIEALINPYIIAESANSKVNMKLRKL